MLDGYKTNPKNEIRKISALLKEHVSFDGRTIWELISLSFAHSEFSEIETDLHSFYTNLILKNDNFSGLGTDEVVVLQYRFLCELIFNLLDVGQSYSIFIADAKEILQLKGLIKHGLQLCGYKMEWIKKHYVTRKLDIHAEAVAIANKDYKDYIFDYLIAKSVNDKEHALLNICNKLESIKIVDGYTKHSRDYIQLLRHPDERKNIDKYSWFYRKDNYLLNLDRLFRILLTYIAHLNSYRDLNEFDKNCSEKYES